MDADRLVALLRSWRSGPTRRDLTHALSGVALATPLAVLLGAADGAAKKKRKKKKKKCKKSKKKCGKKCIAKSSCCVGGTVFADGALCGDDACTLCQAGTCASLCDADETCLVNGSCGTTCENDGQCAMGTCACSAEEGDDPVCRVLVGVDLTCPELQTCNSTADCPADSVCSSICDPSRCVPLCTT